MKHAYLLLGCLIWSATACKQDREIKVYHLAKEAAASPTAEPPATSHSGMPSPMAAGDPHAGLTADQLAATSLPVSPQFGDVAPAGWSKQALTPMRLASYAIAGDGGITADISFSILRQAPGGTLANVNRWRDQLGLPPIDDAALKQAAQVITTSFGEGILVDLDGLPAGADAAKDGRLLGAIADHDGGTWFFKMRGNSGLVAAEKDHFIQWVATVKPAAVTPRVAAPPVALAGGRDGGVTWQIPNGWTAVATASAMRYATLSVVAADGSKGELAVSHFPGDVGGDLENVNRWRQQVSLPPVDAAALVPLVTRVAVGPPSFSVVDLTGPQTRLVAGWTRHGADTWFFKFTGPDALVEAEKPKFTAFLESVRFNKPE